MESPVCRETGLRIIRRIELEEGGRILLDQTLCNESNTPAHRGIWNVTQCLRPFTVWIPAKISAIRPYPEEGDSIKLLPKVIREKGDWSSIICQDPLHFKFGALLDKGILIAFRESRESTLLWTRSFSVEKEGAYAHNAAVEVYNSPTYHYCEIEVHAPLVPLKKGERISHRQEWSFTSEKRVVPL